VAEETNAAVELAAQYGDIPENTSAQPSVASAPEPAVRSPVPAAPPLNAAGRPYDPATGRLLPLSAEPAEEAPPAPTLPTISPYLLQMAEDFGIHTQGRSEEAVAAAVHTAQQMVLKNQQMAAQAHAHGVIKTDQQPQPVPSEPETDPLPELKDDQWDAQLTGPIKKKFSAMEKLVKAQQARIDQLERHMTNQVGLSVKDKMDRTILALKDPRFGSGTLEECSPSERKRRIHLANIAMTEAGAKASIDQICAKVKEAHGLLYGDVETPKNPPPKPAAPDRFATGAVGRPTHRAGAAEPPGVQKAIQSVTELKNEWARNGTVQPESDDEFPD
jgi:hypothetical protein